MIKGFACGVFDLYHAGHALMLKECSENCDYLVVGLNAATETKDGKNKPIFPLEQRKIILASIKYINEIVVYYSEEELTNILKEWKFDIRFLGDDYKDKKITDSGAVIFLSL